MKRDLKWFVDRIGKQVHCMHKLAFTGPMVINDQRHAEYLFNVAQADEQGYTFDDVDYIDLEGVKEEPETKKEVSEVVTCRVGDKSSSIERISYREKDQVLEVEFKAGKTYQYSEFKNWKDLINAESIGSYISRNVIRKYESTPVTEKVFSIVK